MTTPTLAAPSLEPAGARRATTARGDDNGDARPTSAVALAATQQQHTTRRELIGGGSDERGDGRTEDGGRADVRAFAHAIFVNGRNQFGSKSRLFVDGGAASLAADPAAARLAAALCFV